MDIMRIASKMFGVIKYCNYSNITDRKIHKNIFIVNIMYIAATILLMVFSPIDSVNKRLDDNDKNSVKK